MPTQNLNSSIFFNRWPKGNGIPFYHQDLNNLKQTRTLITRYSDPSESANNSLYLILCYFEWVIWRLLMNKCLQISDIVANNIFLALYRPDYHSDQLDSAKFNSSRTWDRVLFIILRVLLSVQEAGDKSEGNLIG